MNIEAYNLDSLRKLVRALQAENKELRDVIIVGIMQYARSKRERRPIVGIVSMLVGPN